MRQQERRGDRRHAGRRWLALAGGDSGGPLIRQGQDGSFIQVGIVSRGVPGCRTEIAPDVFTNVGYFAGWIKDEMQQGEKTLKASAHSALTPDAAVIVACARLAR